MLNETLKGAVSFTADFVSNGISFSSISVVYFFGRLLMCYDAETVYNAISSTPWISGEAYRTITFLEPPTGDLLTWLQANGVKQ